MDGMNSLMKMSFLHIYRFPTNALCSFADSTIGLVPSQRVEYTNYPHDAGVVGFVDGVDFAICKPTEQAFESTFYSGHKKMNCVVHQGVILPNGIIASFYGPWPGRNNATGVWAKIGIRMELIWLNQVAGQDGPNQFKLFEDSIYAFEDHLSRMSRENAVQIREGFRRRRNKFWAHVSTASACPKLASLT